MPLPADLAVTANLTFSEPPKLTSQSPAVQERLDQLVEDGTYTMPQDAVTQSRRVEELDVRALIGPGLLQKTKPYLASGVGRVLSRAATLTRSGT